MALIVRMKTKTQMHIALICIKVISCRERERESERKGERKRKKSRYHECWLLVDGNLD